jgi:hypothetical protein
MARTIESQDRTITELRARLNQMAVRALDAEARNQKPYPEPYQEQADDHDARDDYPDHTPAADAACDECPWGGVCSPPHSLCDDGSVWDEDIVRGGCMADWDALTLVVPLGAYGMMIAKRYTMQELDDLFQEENDPVAFYADGSILDGTMWDFYGNLLLRIDGHWESEDV